MITFRQATIDDVVPLSALRFLMRDEREGKLSEHEQKIFKTNTINFFTKELSCRSFCAFIAEDNKKIIATSGLTIYHLPPTHKNISGKCAYLMNMYTLPDYRKQGVGGNLLKLIMAHASKIGCECVQLNSSDMGRQLYEKHGFVDVNGEMAYRFY